jgi:hypothetical protein
MFMMIKKQDCLLSFLFPENKMQETCSLPFLWGMYRRIGRSIQQFIASPPSQMGNKTLQLPQYMESTPESMALSPQPPKVYFG